MVPFKLSTVAILAFQGCIAAGPIPREYTLPSRWTPVPPAYLAQYASPSSPGPPAQPKFPILIHSEQAPIPRVHTVPRSQLNNFAGIPVPPASPLQPRSSLPPFIHDDRYIWDNQNYPAYAFGQIMLGRKSYENGKPRSCSGSLVGPRHVMTARHCISQNVNDFVRFESNFFNGPRGGPSFTEDIIITDEVECPVRPVWPDKNGQCSHWNDWAILILADRIGEKYGYLGIKQLDAKAQRNKPLFSHVGFPGRSPSSEVKPMRQDGISVAKCSGLCVPGDQLMTDVDGEIGASGGPLFRMEDGLAWQYGTLSGRTMILSENKPPLDKAVFSSSVKFITAVAMAREQFP
ncbi:trypsin serine protease [Fusarium beomiforme]|uniref:Trypsin serine protease n=1 Tax=Fusarium beomiforme TaxID=44412 RepID=A0A9P5AN08_9HYPO|nr:trypsin serine protease [Fusarium beomiforme]